MTTTAIPTAPNDGFEVRLSTPLDSLEIPTRLANFLDRRGLRVVAELARLAPEELLLEKNLGRKSVADARAAIQAAVGASWEEVRRYLLQRDGTTSAAEPSPTGDLASPERQVQRWERFRASLAAVERMPLSDLELPTRLYNFARPRGIETLGGLLALAWDDFSKAKNIGRGTIAATLAVVESIVERLGTAPQSETSLGQGGLPPSSAAVVGIPEGSRWLTLLVQALGSLDGRERMIVTQRAGLAGPVPTLEELGEVFGVSRERIRQLEVLAIERLRRRLPSKAMAQRLEAACHVLVEATEVVAARDAVFTIKNEEEGEAFAFLINEVLESDVHAVVLEDRLLLSRTNKNVLQARMARVQALIEGASFPIEEDALAHDVAVSLDIGVMDSKALFDLIGGSLKRDGTRILGFGRTRIADVLAMLRAASGPVAKAEVEAIYGRGSLPEEVVFVDHGLLSLAEKFEGWDRWQRRLPGLVRKILVEQGPERQWSTYELMEPLATACELPEWMNSWTLGSLLRRSSEIEYLGRNVVALPRSTRASEGEMERVQIMPKLLEILTAHGGPMPAEEARRALEQVRGLSEHSWTLYSQRPPMLGLDGGMLGLFPRDVPGGNESGQARAERVLRTLYEWLADAQKGIFVHELGRFLAELGAIAEGYTPRMLRSVARQDGRFRLSQSGAIGLAEWESVRVPTQSGMLEELITQGGGETTVELARERIRTRDGEPIARGPLTNLAISVGARIAGDRILRRVAAAKADLSNLTAGVLETLPERTAAVFEDLLEEVQRNGASSDAHNLSGELAGWEATLRLHAATDAPHIELDQVTTIASDARSLLLQLGDLEGEPRALAEAAIRYVICTDDADTDMSVGGLDDDEAVLARVAAALGVFSANSLPNASPS